MKHCRWVLPVLLLSVVISGIGAQESEPGWISVGLDDHPTVGFKPRSEPYVDGGPRVAIPIEARADVVVTDGIPIRRLAFIGWIEEDGVRVLAYGLSGRLQTFDTGPRRYLGSTHVSWDSEATFTALSELGFPEVTLWGGPAPDSR